MVRSDHELVRYKVLGAEEATMEIRRVGKEVGRQESQCVDGRSNVNCDPEEAVR